MLILEDNWNKLNSSTFWEKFFGRNVEMHWGPMIRLKEI